MATMGGKRPGFPGDDVLSCCGHARRLHDPSCTYWIPGTRDDPPRVCGCAGEDRDAPSDGADVPR
ncbi:MAG TPA: hypothetical protein VE826_07655 [Dongiaceae bacterium]|nr:hypothetical protein [Dongiaceae bacterium]